MNESGDDPLRPERVFASGKAQPPPHYVETPKDGFAR